jgi:hypothetical protein
VRIDDRLGKGEQRLARTVDRDDLGIRVDPVEAIAALQPAGNALPQFAAAERGRIAGQSARAAVSASLMNCRRCVLRLADREPDLALLRVRRDAGEELAQFLERIRLQLAEGGDSRARASRGRTLDYKGHRSTLKGEAPQTALASAPREGRLAVAALLGGALVWGLIWYPYRILRDLGVDGVAASTATYAIALVLGLLFFRRPPPSSRRRGCFSGWRWPPLSAISATCWRR